jgi:hypothetical protein
MRAANMTTIAARHILENVTDMRDAALLPAARQCFDLLVL